MKNTLKNFEGRSFKYCGKIYAVKEIKVINQKAVIKTDGQTFVKTDTELESFIGDIEFVATAQKAVNSKTAQVVKESWIPAEVVPAKATPLQAEIVVAESNASKVANKLMEVFESLSESPNEATYKKAAAMVNVSNSIVNVQMAQIKFLSLKK